MPEWVLFFGAISLFVLLVAGILIGLHRAHLRRLKQGWEAAKRRIQFGPVGAGMSTLRSRQKDSHGVTFGALAIVDGQLIYTGTFGHLYNVAVPADHIHWIGLQKVNPSRTISRVIVHFEGPGGWQVYTFHPRSWRAFADALGAVTGLALQEAPPLAEALRGLQPVQATRMTQNVYGQWQPDFSDTLYLAPDRLLFAWQNPIMLGEIRELDFYDRPGFLDTLNPFAPDLLRITWERDGANHVTAYQWGSARTWGEALADRCGVALRVHQGRKKKASEDEHTANAPEAELDAFEDADSVAELRGDAPDSEQRRRA